VRRDLQLAIQGSKTAWQVDWHKLQGQGVVGSKMVNSSSREDKGGDHRLSAEGKRLVGGVYVELYEAES